MTDDATAGRSPDTDRHDFTLAEAADRLGLSRDALRKRCDRGLVDGAYKTDGRWLIPAVSLTGHADRSTGRDFLTVRPVSHTPDLTGQAVTAAIEALVAQLAEKDRQIAELHALLDQARQPERSGRPAGQPALAPGQPTEPAPAASPPRPWWAFWR